MNAHPDKIGLAADTGEVASSRASPGKSGADNRLSAKPARSRSMTLILASQIALGLLVAVATSILVLQLRSSALLEAGRELRSLALILADQAERSFEAVDLVETTFLEIVQAEGIRTTEAFRQRMDGAAINKELDDHGSALPQLDVIGLVDNEGEFINVSHHFPAPRVTIADRPYFVALKTDPNLTTVVSDPIVNRLTHTRAVVLAHRVSAPDGRFLGISFAGILMSYFENLYRTAVSGPDMSIALFRRDGRMLAHYPQPQQDLETVDARIAAIAGTGADSAEMEVKSAEDGQLHRIAGHALAHYPMLVTVSATTASILAPWRKQATYLIGLALLVECVIAAVGFLMIRYLRGQALLAQARAATAEAEAAKRGAEAEVALAHERERADRDMRIQHLRLGAALSTMSQALCMHDADGRLVVTNRRFEELFDLPPVSTVDDATTVGMRDLLARSSNLAPADLQAMIATHATFRTEGKRASYVRELADGRSLSVNFAPVEDGGWLMTMEDITERRQVEARIAHMAHHDALTGLPNRVLFHEKLADTVARGLRGETSAVLFLDLDHFKAVNDTLGHPAGDALLKDVTQRLLGQVRETDTVARLGGDEFAIVQSGIVLPDDATVLARRLIDAICAPYDIAGNRVTIGTSIGIAVIPGDGADPDQILKSADLALYRAKEEGRGRYRYFEQEMDERVQARRALELDLREALVQGEFAVHYQPLINLRTRSVCGLEALVRWHHPERGLVAPSAFISVAEEIGLIVPLGDWVLRQACRDAMTWPGKLKVAVNLSPVQFGSATLVEDITAALAESGLAPQRLELEITETVMLADTGSVLSTLYRLRNLGVGIAMDDFGTGYSSLAYLQRFPFSKVKIDRSFVAALGAGGDSNVIVAAVAMLCTTLGMATLAEGVETEAQLTQLMELGCLEAQGYLFSHPRPASEVADMCKTLRFPELLEWGRRLSA